MARTGRPRGFDRALAVQQAMHLFWQQGYEATTLDQIKLAMGGISPASFYAAFGSKEALYREALAQYLATHGQVMATLRDPSVAPRDAIEAALRRSARMQTAITHPSGCMVALAGTVGMETNKHLYEVARLERQANREAFRACVERAIISGDLDKEVEPGSLATMLEAFLLGISILARDGVTGDIIDGAVNQALAIWDQRALTIPPLMPANGKNSETSAGVKTGRGC